MKLHVPLFLGIIILLVLMQILLVTIILAYKPPNYGAYNYPHVANVFGMIFAVIPVIPIPVMAFIEVRKAEGNTLFEVKFFFIPSALWQVFRLSEHGVSLPVCNFSVTVFSPPTYHKHQIFCLKLYTGTSYFVGIQTEARLTSCLKSLFIFRSQLWLLEIEHVSRSTFPHFV